MQTSSLTRPSALSGSTGTTRPSQSTRSSTGSTPRARTLLIMEVRLRSVLDARENNEICRHQGGLQGLPLICCKTRGGKKTAWTAELLPSPGKTTELDLITSAEREIVAKISEAKHWTLYNQSPFISQWKVFIDCFWPIADQNTLTLSLSHHQYCVRVWQSRCHGSLSY